MWKNVHCLVIPNRNRGDGFSELSSVFNSLAVTFGAKTTVAIKMLVVTSRWGWGIPCERVGSARYKLLVLVIKGLLSLKVCKRVSIFWLRFEMGYGL